MSNTLTEQLNKALAAIDEAQKVAQKLVGESLGEIITAGAAAAKRNGVDVIGFGWIQYTPYFNDGEACEFSVGDYGWLTRDSIIDGLRYEYSDEDLEDLKAKSDEELIEFMNDDVRMYCIYECVTGLRELEEKDPDFKEIDRAISGVMNQEDIMRSIFGEHSKVVVDTSGKATITDVSDQHD